ncbi:DUF6493 family protein [Cellulomonas sp.]|uniref:DUF6493 family protein n=1 Tax=Cellulomonas sp. TaxID=40001 RepID=UPI001B019CBF|nr:DUF6493 family protein [Cellulomonas sp.]MBO9556568.1 hypothetical protein [Cellulomonas sp.]
MTTTSGADGDADADLAADLAAVAAAAGVVRTVATSDGPTNEPDPYPWWTVVTTAELEAIPDDVLVGLLRELGEAVVAEPGERPWQVDLNRWNSVRRACVQAAAGVRPRAPGGAAPTWLGRLTRARLETLSTAWTHGHHEWRIIRTLERRGLVTLPHDDTYTLAFVGTLGGGDPVEAVRTDPCAVDVLWQCFLVEGGGEVSLANVDKYGGGAWSTAVLTLVREGDLDRDRVLAAALNALGLDFSAYRAGWFSRLWTSLDPTVDEVAAHQPALRRLLRSDVRPTVALAVTALRRLAEAGLLDAPAAVDALGPAVVAPVKGTALAAVALVGTAVAGGDVPAESVASTLAVALEHPHADVQRAAARLLVRLGRVDLVEAAREGLAPSVVADVLPVGPAPDGRGTGSDDPDSEGGSARAVEVDAGAAQVGSVGGVNATAGTRPVDVGPTLPVDVGLAMPMAVTRTDVTERVAALLEDPSDPAELEAVLACLASEGDASLVEPLGRRASTLVRRAYDGYTEHRLQTRVAMLVERAVGAPTPVPPGRVRTGRVPPSIAFLTGRLDDVADVLRGAAPTRPLVATPTTRAGWVDAAAFVDRWTAAISAPAPRDVVAGLLRLAPDGREEALGRWRAVAPGAPWADAVAYALGAAPPVTAPPGADVAVWVAASRARAPLAHDPTLHAWGVTGPGRSAPLAPDPAGVFAAEKVRWSLPWHVAHLDAPDGHDDQPTTDPGGEYLAENGFDGWVPWIATTWPADAEHVALVASTEVWWAVDMTALHRDALDVVVALGDHEGRIGDLAATTLVAGLTSARVDLRVHAVDAVARQVRAGRLDVDRTARAVTTFAPDATVTRWAASWADLAATGPDLGSFVVDLLVAVLPDLPPETRGRHALLDLLDEELLRARRATPSALVPWLATVTGSSRAARTAARLAARREA